MTRRSTGTRPRILVLTTTLPARPDDGTPAFVLELAQALSEENDLTILAPRVPASAARERLGEVEIRRFPYFPRRFEGLADGAIMPNLQAEPWRIVEVPPLLLGFLRAAAMEVRRTGPDLVHAHWLLPGGALALTLRRLFGVPYIVTAHAADVFRLRAGPFQALKRRIVARAAVVSPVSLEGAEVLGFSAEEAERLVVPMGVDVDRIQGLVGERAPENGRFLFVGRLVEKKGLDVLLRALAEVPDGRLVAVGDGPLRGELEALSRELGVSGRVDFAGRQGPSRVAEELRFAHALVVPSRIARDGDADGTPVVMGEGMAAGVPVIASRLGGLSEHISSDQTGLLVAPDDPLALADGLRQLLARPEEGSGWANAAQRRVRERLDIRVTAQRYQEFIDVALERARAPSTSSQRRKA
jgi:glycosyltransferase involved in cell wall biosynthesis